MEHPHQHQEGQKAQNSRKSTILIESKCLKCVEGSLTISYCCPRQAFMRCSCREIDTKIPIEHVEHLGRAIPLIIKRREEKS